MERIIAQNPDVIVIVDEAYIDFGGTSALPLIDKYDNVLVVQTFSKSHSMAGMRIGYAMAQPELIKYLNDVKYSFNSYTLNSLTIEMGTAAILPAASYHPFHLFCSYSSRRMVRAAKAGRRFNA